jgi:hypothetical protein
MRRFLWNLQKLKGFICGCFILNFSTVWIVNSILKEILCYSFLLEAGWTPGLLLADRRNSSIENFLDRYQKSKPGTSRLVEQCLNQLHRSTGIPKAYLSVGWNLRRPLTPKKFLWPSPLPKFIQRKKCVENMDKISFAPLTVYLSLKRFWRNSLLLNEFMGRRHIPNFTQIGHEMWKVRVEIHWQL